MSKKLTQEIILAKHKADNIESVKFLNLWGNELVDVEIIATMKKLEIVSLSGNNINDLKPFSSLHNLTELYLRKNQISDLEELKNLQTCKKLKFLWLEENPCCAAENYRKKVLKILPQLAKLDNKEVQEPERKMSRKCYSILLNGKSDFNLTNDLIGNISTGTETDFAKSTNIKTDRKVKISIRASSSAPIMDNSMHVITPTDFFGKKVFDFSNKKIGNKNIRIINLDDNNEKENANSLNLSNLRSFHKNSQNVKQKANNVIVAVESLISNLGKEELAHVQSLVNKKLESFSQ